MILLHNLQNLDLDILGFKGQTKAAMMLSWTVSID
jgi:hypothetical protein